MNAIVFDLDGTLVEFEERYATIVERAIESVVGRVEDGWVETYTETFFEYFARFEPHPVERAFQASGAPADGTELAAALLEAEIEAIRTPAGIHEDLSRLAETYRLAVLTNGVPEWQGEKLATRDLDQYFEVVVASYEVGAHKPDPAPFHAVEARLDADAYAIVGDSDGDVAGGEAVGWAASRYDGGGFGHLPEAIDWPESRDD